MLYCLNTFFYTRMHTNIGYQCRCHCSLRCSLRNCCRRHSRRLCHWRCTRRLRRRHCISWRRPHKRSRRHCWCAAVVLVGKSVHRCSICLARGFRWPTDGQKRLWKCWSLLWHISRRRSRCFLRCFRSCFHIVCIFFGHDVSGLHCVKMPINDNLSTYANSKPKMLTAKDDAKRCNVTPPILTTTCLGSSASSAA